MGAPRALVTCDLFLRHLKPVTVGPLNAVAVGHNVGPVRNMCWSSSHRYTIQSAPKMNSPTAFAPASVDKDPRQYTVSLWRAWQS